jgi:hypothetical protein
VSDLTPEEQAQAEAAASEAAIADEAATIRGDATVLSPALLNRLWPLLRRPIPAAYIKQTPAVKGKPYESTGVRSVQVQIDRMNAVLTPLWWWDVVHYEDGGKLALVTICIGNYQQHREGVAEPVNEVLAARQSMGGVNQGSTLGNIYKGSYTNAAKRAFAALGPGHEVYLGAADLDPDVNAEVAEAQEGTGPATVGKNIAGRLVDRAWEIEGARERLQLAASHAASRDVGECDTKAHATDALAGLTYGQMEKLSTWVDGKEQAAKQQAAPADGEQQQIGGGADV